MRFASSFVAAASVMLLSTAAFAQSDMHKMAAPAPPSDSQIAFDAMKTLAGEWEGPVATDLPMAKNADIKPIHVTMRVTSRGNVLVHEFQEAGTPLDPAKFDHPVTMLYRDADRLNLVHYCDAGNRPHMTARLSQDRKTMDFDFADLSGSDGYGHMHHVTFTFVDDNHHIEDWTYMMPGNKPVHARFELARKSGNTVATPVPGR